MGYINKMISRSAIANFYRKKDLLTLFDCPIRRTQIADNAKAKMTPFEKHQFNHVLKELEQGLKAQDKGKYLTFFGM